MTLPYGFGESRKSSAEPGQWNFNSEWTYKWHAMFILGIALVAFFITSTAVLDWYLERQVPWEMKKVSAILQAGLDTNNVERKVSYVKQASSMLEQYHGNSGWWNPTANTDIDVTRQVLLDTALDVEKQIPVQDKEQWMFLPHEDLNNYLNLEIERGQDRVLEYGYAWKHNAHLHPLYVFWGIYLLVSFTVFMFGLAGLANNWDRIKTAVLYDGWCHCGEYVLPPAFKIENLGRWHENSRWDVVECVKCNRKYDDNRQLLELRGIKYAKRE